MSYPVFASGDVLNASDMNAVGLWLVKTQTIGSAVSSVTVTNAFSADYDNYRIVWSGTNCSVGDFATIFKLGSNAGTAYYSNMTYYKLGAGQGFLPIANASTGVYNSIQGTANDTGCVMDISNPFNSARTVMSGAGFGFLSQFTFAAMLADTTSYSSFTINTGSGTFTGGTIRVYGYRN